MSDLAQGIPHLFDLTHPNELSTFAVYFLLTLLVFIIITGFFGSILAMLLYSGSRNGSEKIMSGWLEKYGSLIYGLQHTILVAVIIVPVFLLCSTLANRYHYWERSKINKVAESVSGDLIEQPSPVVRYVVKSVVAVDTVSNGQLIKTKQDRFSTYYLNIAASDIKVILEQFLDHKKQQRSIYKVDFQAAYEVVNTLDNAQDLIFDAPQPYGYTLLEAFTVELNGKRQKAGNQGASSFDFRLNPGEKAEFNVRYQAQGGPRWVYNAYNTLLSNFKLQIQAKFPDAEFASGVMPSEIIKQGSDTVFNWNFKENVAVKNPFGVFTGTQEIRNTGVLPRLLVLAPGVLLWWFLLLYLTMPVSFRQVIQTSGLFFAVIMSLTYLSRFMDANTAWFILSVFTVFIAWKLSPEPKYHSKAIICVLTGFILPVFGLLISYTGISLSLAGLLSVTFLAVRNS